MRRLPVFALCALLLALTLALAAGAIARPGACVGCADHKEWPRINGVLKIKKGGGSAKYTGTRKNDELLGNHGSDTLEGMEGSDVLWGDYDPTGQPATQKDVFYGAGGSDFIYGSHGHNIVYGGKGNDAISVHYGYGMVDCGPGRDIYHVARTRKHRWTFRNCEKVDYRTESARGGRGLKPLRGR